MFRTAFPQEVQQAATARSISGWWKELSSDKLDKFKKRRIAFSVYVVWHTWKERGGRIFQHVEMSPAAVVGLIRADLELLELAHREGVEEV